MSSLLLRFCLLTKMQSLSQAEDELFNTAMNIAKLVIYLVRGEESGMRFFIEVC